MIEASQKLVNVLQGDYAISDDPNDVLTTVLGSCVAVCLFDCTRGIGGMNHFLLPRGEADGSANMRYGVHAMELLINGLLRAGADKARLEAKIFGGARMNSNLRDIGSANASFAQAFLNDEGIPLRASSLYGSMARRIRFWPTTGRVRQMLVDNSVDVLASERPMPQRAATADDPIILF